MWLRLGIDVPAGAETKSTLIVKASLRGNNLIVNTATVTSPNQSQPVLDYRLK